MIAALAIAATCSWDSPGADRYTGRVDAAIASYGFEPAVAAALAAAYERREFFDVVTIDRDSIRGTAAGYDPAVRDMHFGSRGRRCAEVTRSGWPADRVERALVVCAAGECVAVPSVCGNVFRITRAPGPGAPLLLPPPDEHGEPGPLAPPAAFVPGAPEPGPGWSYGAAAGAPAYFGAVPAAGLGGACCCAPAYAAAVPEPSTWAMLAAGLLGVWRFRRQRCA